MRGCSCGKKDPASEEAGYKKLFARRLNGSEQRAQTRGILSPRTRFDATGNVYRVRLRDSNGFSDIFRRQSARENNSSIARRRPRQTPIQRAARTAVQPARKTIEQNSVRAPIPRKTFRPKSFLHAHSLNHAMRSPQHRQSAYWPATKSPKKSQGASATTTGE